MMRANTSCMESVLEFQELIAVILGGGSLTCSALHSKFRSRLASDMPGCIPSSDRFIIENHFRAALADLRTAGLVNTVQDCGNDALAPDAMVSLTLMGMSYFHISLN